MAYIGQGIKQGTFKVLDTSGNTYNGSNTTFSLGTQVGSAAQLLVSHDGVIQLPGTDYTLASGGASITFSTAPASGASIFIVEISGAVGGTVTPSDTSVTADKLNSALLTGLTDIGAGIADADLFLVDDGAGGTLRKVAASRLSTYISPTSATDSFSITGSTPTLTIGDGGEEDVKIQFDGNAQDFYIGLDDSGDELQIGKGSTLGASRELSFGASGPVFNEDSDTHDFRVESDDKDHAIFVHGASDYVLLGSETSSAGSAYDQVLVSADHKMQVAKASGTPFEVNRNTNDGNLIDLRQAGTAEGTISVSGSTVSYNTFMGAHWSQLADNSKPTILRGTVLESIAEMCTWYTVKFDVNQHDSGKSERYHYEEYELSVGKSVGDTVTITHGDKSFSGVIEKEINLTLPKFKISDTEESKAVYGVFHRWDDDDNGENWQNDASIASLGTYMIRIHKDETVAIGDYIQSKGDGTGKKQSDDILRASTIGKVTSTEKVITHDDGSYCVPCTLHCG